MGTVSFVTDSLGFHSQASMNMIPVSTRVNKTKLVPDLAISNLAGASAGFGEDLFWDRRTIHLIKLMVSTMLSAARKRQYSSVLPLLCHQLLGLHRISALASAKPKFGHFSQIRPNSASAKFLAEFGRRQCNCSVFS